jgi:hypothetical protein
MVYFCILLTFAILFIGYRVYILENLPNKNKIDDKEGIKVFIKKDRIGIEDVDNNNNQFLKDLIESAKIEDWEVEVDYTDGWSIELTSISNSGDIKFTTIIRNIESTPSIGYFNIRNLNTNNSASYSIEVGGEAYEKVIRYAVEKLNDKIDAENKEKESYYKEFISNLDSKFLTLNREKKLKKLLNT